MLANLNTKFLIILGLVLLLIIVMIYVYYKYFSTSPSYVANREFIKTHDKKHSHHLPDHHHHKPHKKYASVILFSADWCPYCNQLQESGIYDKFEEENSGKEIKGYTIKVEKKNCTDETDINIQKLLVDYNIDGFPTILLSKEDEKKSEAKEFNCQPTLHNLNEFLKNSL